MDDRVETVLARMTPAEKAGMMFHPPISFRFAATGDARRAEALQAIERLVLQQHITHFNIRGLVHGEITPTVAASWLNDIQQIARRSRLGIPVTISTDPRHGFADHLGVRMSSGHFSRWPEPIALAATRDPELVRSFADVVRREYRAIGIHMALHPQADLATEPRWMRISGTFGQDAGLAAAMVTAYIQGIQGERLGPAGVACMTKHFPGGGPQKDGEDPHFAYGKEQTYEGGYFDYHLQPFRAAIAAGTAALMPYYGKPVGTPAEEVGFAFNADIIAGLLRGELGYDGVVCSDWGILTDGVFEGQVMPAIAWGVEHLELGDRIQKALDAGIDQFGGETCTAELLRLLEAGRITEERLDASVRRLLTQKFQLGLFDDPFTDPDAATGIVGKPSFVSAGLNAQRRSVTVLKNELLPLPTGTACRLIGFDIEAARAYCEPDPEGAVTLIRIAAPYEPRLDGFARFHRAGRLTFTDAELRELLALVDGPAVLAIELDRPAVFPELLEAASTVLAFCGAADAALLDVMFGIAKPEGRLPFDLPRSMSAVEQHHPDQPGGTADPVLPYGFGLSL